MLKRFFDIVLVLISLPLVLPLFVVTFLLVICTSSGGALYWSQRVGKHNLLFSMPKFRSMHVNTPALATHVMNSQANAKQYLTPVGSFIRKTSLDEVPQLWCVLKGEMTIVGPRPALFNQADLIGLRTEKNIHLVNPGITGWAQVNGRDELPIPKKVDLDDYYVKNQSFGLDCYIMALTVIKVLKRDGVTH
jgi:O-antigen biosynthesis protein WbqP